jgi:hypothetical protein
MTLEVIKLPSNLTDKDGSRELLDGKFKIHATLICNACRSNGTCEVCSCTGWVLNELTIPYDTIKDIYKMIVENLKVK